MDVAETLEKYIVEELMVKDASTKIDPDASLISSGVVDSLALLRLISFIEEKFGVLIEDEEVIPDNFETLNIMKSFIENKLT